ncbi:class I SAM-dependent methyltransferase [Bradyrhizobium sp. Arg314]
MMNGINVTLDRPWDEFTGEGENYDRARPSYPTDVAKAVRSHLEQYSLSSPVVDVGCGTGVFTRVLAHELSTMPVIGIDPNDDMVRVAKKATPSALDIEYRVATAEELPFGSDSLSVVAAAAAAHRFQRDKFYAGATRSLQKNGLVIILHNKHCWWKSDALLAYHDLVEACTPEYSCGTVTTARGTYAAVDFAAELSDDQRFKDVRVRRWYWDLNSALPDFLALSFSSNLIQRSAIRAGREQVIERLTGIFHKYSRDGLLCQPYMTEVTFAIKA